MQSIKVSEFFKSFDPFNLGAFFGFYEFSDDKELIFTYSAYKESKKFLPSEPYILSLENYTDELNQHSILKNWTKNTESTNIPKHKQFIFILKNDLKLNKNDFFSKLYSFIVTNMTTFTDEAKHKFLRGFFELRGSVDVKFNFLPFDYHHNSDFELRRFQLLISFFGLPDYIFNSNFRELQPEYYSDKNKRKTQFRLNLRWYVKNIGFISSYKAELYAKRTNEKYTIKDNAYFFEKVSQTTQTRNSDTLKRIEKYSNIVGVKLSQYEIDELRKDMGLDNENNDDFSRDANLIQVFKLGTKDECASCKDKYDIKDRSFEMARYRGRFYTEIHHFISIGKNKDLDVSDNLTKLCPVCHRALKRGASSESYQKKIINHIMNNNKSNLDFAAMLFQTNNKNILIQKVYENLK